MFKKYQRCLVASSSPSLHLSLPDHYRGAGDWLVPGLSVSLLIRYGFTFHCSDIPHHSNTRHMKTVQGLACSKSGVSFCMLFGLEVHPMAQLAYWSSKIMCMLLLYLPCEENKVEYTVKREIFASVKLMRILREAWARILFLLAIILILILWYKIYKIYLLTWHRIYIFPHVT